MQAPLLILGIIAAYFCMLLGVGHLASRGADNSTFFAGNRRIPWPLVALAMVCAPISGVTFISVPGMVVTKGYGYLQMCFGFIAGYLVIAAVLIPLYYRNNIVSIYSFLGERFGMSTHRTGAWMFLISKLLGTAVRFLVICVSLQLLVFGPIGLPFPFTVLITVALVWLYTWRGGVKAVVWTDMVKCLCLVTSVVMAIYFVINALGFSFSDTVDIIQNHSTCHIFNFDDPLDDTYFWKQFLAGLFLVVAMTGLDQDMMQHALTCRDSHSSRKNMVLSSFMQFVVIGLFLCLGTLLVVYSETHGVEMSEKTDNLFATVAFHDGLPAVVGILFIVGLVSATYSSIGSALTSLTTSFTVDIMQFHKKDGTENLAKKRHLVHMGMALVLSVSIIIFYYAGNQDAISAVYTLASYTYGPILGLFVFGLCSKREVRSRFIPWICIASPLLAWLIQWIGSSLAGYNTGFELLLINAGLTVAGLYAFSVRRSFRAVETPS